MQQPREGGSLWSADAWSRFGSLFFDPRLSGQLNDSAIRSECEEARWQVSAQGPDHVIDYQSGSEHPHSKGSSLWSADAWSRFGSLFFDPRLSGQLNDSAIRSECEEA